MSVVVPTPTPAVYPTPALVMEPSVRIAPDGEAVEATETWSPEPPDAVRTSPVTYPEPPVVPIPICATVPFEIVRVPCAAEPVPEAVVKVTLKVPAVYPEPPVVIPPRVASCPGQVIWTWYFAERNVAVAKVSTATCEVDVVVVFVVSNASASLTWRVADGFVVPTPTLPLT